MDRLTTETYKQSSDSEAHSDTVHSNEPFPEPASDLKVHDKDPLDSVYTSREKWFIVAVVAFAGLFRWALLPLAVARSLLTLSLYSPLTANVYFPAIPTIAHAFNSSTEVCLQFLTGLKFISQGMI